MADAQQLVIVRRNQFAKFALLAQAFADEPSVRLIWDRRLRERRGEHAASDPERRRRRDRRCDLSKTWGHNDYLLLGVAARVESDTAQTEAIATRDANTDESTRVSDAVGLDIEVAVRSDLQVLISGGDALSRKSLAYRIHRRSDRADRPLIVVERDAFIEFLDAFHTEVPFQSRISGTDSPHAPWGRSIEGGTLLIEEVTDLSWEQQSELMLFLDRRAVQQDGHRGHGFRDPRIISGTSYWLLDRIASKEFRADLFYRLNAIHLVLPRARHERSNSAPPFQPLVE
jgi:DNA-binding NtrC family response regulator